MKKTLYLLPVILLLGVGLSTCKDEEEEKSTDPYFTVDGVSLEPLTFGFLYDFGQNPDEYEGTGYYVELLSSGFTYLEELNTYNGSGDMMLLCLYSNTLGELNSGTYDFYTSSGAILPTGIFTEESCWITGYLSNESYGCSISSGTIKISNKENQAYEITIDCIDNEDHTVNAFFNGVLHYQSAGNW